MGRFYGELKVNINSLLSTASAADATIYIAIAPIYDTMAWLGIILCLYATISRSVCTKDRATAASIHILLAVWITLLWRDSTSDVAPLFLSLVVRGLVLAVSVILVFSARLNFISPRQKKRQELEDVRN